MPDFVDTILQPMPQEEILEYHASLICHVTEEQGDIEVVPDVGRGKGKGVVACQAIQHGTRILTEAPLVGEQHVANRQHALICDQCFCYIGPLELQLGFRLLSLAEQASEPSAPETCSLRQTALDLLSGEVQAPAVEWEPERPLTAAAAAEVPLTLRMLLHHCSVSQQQLPPQQTTKQGSVTVLGNAIILPDGSEWMFCSHDCAALAWTTWAAALSPGPRGQLPQAVRTCSFVEAFDPTQLTPRVLHACTVGGRLDAFPAADLSSANSSTSHGLPPWLHGPADAEAVREFYEHAANSNDIFRVAARAVALAAGAACMFEAACDTGLCSRGHGADERLSALHFAWKPFKSIAKAIWWEHVPMPEDLDDEEAWRADLREMACDSLGLLKAAVPGSFPREFLDERIWGCLIGMFELNNLSLQVQTPLELYFLACDDLPEPRRTEVQGQTTVWLDALDTEYDACVEGTALYSVQSCMNHSQDPNAQALKEDYDMDGRVVICATRDIAAGEEVCISYIDLDGSHSEQRQALLDYGITLP